LETKGPNEEYHKTAGKFYKNAVSDVLPKYQSTEPLIGRIAKDVSEGGRDSRIFATQKEGASPALEAHEIKEGLKDDLGKMADWNPDVNQPKNLVDRARLNIANRLTDSLNDNIPAYEKLNQRYEDLKAASKVSDRKMKQIETGRASHATPTAGELFNVPKPGNWLGQVASSVGDIATSPAATRMAAGLLKGLRGSAYEQPKPISPEGYSTFKMPQPPTDIDKSIALNHIIHKYDGLDRLTGTFTDRAKAMSAAATELESRAQKLLENQMVNTKPVSSPVQGIKATEPGVFRTPGASVTPIREQATTMLKDAAELRRLGKDIPPNTPLGPGLLNNPKNPDGGFTPEMDDRDIHATAGKVMDQAEQIFKDATKKKDGEKGYISIGANNPRAFDHTLTPQQRAAELAKIPGKTLADKKESWQRMNAKNSGAKVLHDSIADYIDRRTQEELAKMRGMLTPENVEAILPKIEEEITKNPQKIMEEYLEHPGHIQYVAAHEAAHWVVGHELGIPGDIKVGFTQEKGKVSGGYFQPSRAAVLKAIIKAASKNEMNQLVFKNRQIGAATTGLDERLFGVEGAHTPEQTHFRQMDNNMVNDDDLGDQEYEYLIDSSKDILDSHQAGLDALSHRLAISKKLTNDQATKIYEAAEAKAKQSGGIDLGPLPYLTIGSGAALYGLNKLEKKSGPFKTPNKTHAQR